MSTIDTALILLSSHVAFCTVLFYNCFCRLTKTNDDTEPAVRAGFMVVAVSSAVLGASPWLAGFTPSWVSVAHTASITVLQGITSRYWRLGVPCQYQRPTKENQDV